MAADANDGSGRVPQAVLFDALGTLVDLDDPVRRLIGELAARGADVQPPDAERALRAEIAYYRAHHDEARDAAALDDLRDRCASVVRDALGGDAFALDHRQTRAALLAAVRFVVFDDVVPALDALQAAGVRLAVVSNWDVSLHEVLRETALAGRFEAVLTSAEEQVAKPDPEIFHRALTRLGGVDPALAWHVGDDVRADAEGAAGAGLAPILLDREGAAPPAPAGTRVVRSLAALADLPR